MDKKNMMIGVAGITLLEVDGELVMETFYIDDLEPMEDDYPSLDRRPATKEETEWIVSAINRSQEVLDNCAIIPGDPQKTILRKHGIKVK